MACSLSAKGDDDDSESSVCEQAPTAAPDSSSMQQTALHALRAKTVCFAEKSKRLFLLHPSEHEHTVGINIEIVSLALIFDRCEIVENANA